MDFEVIEWTATTLHDLAYSFGSYWLDQVLLPMQSSDIKWKAVTARVTGTDMLFKVPITGKYGMCPGSLGSNRVFEVGLLYGEGPGEQHPFRLRGVADPYEGFDRPGEENRIYLEKTLALERALVTPFVIFNKDAKVDEHSIVHYVRLAYPSVGASKKGVKREMGKTTADRARPRGAICLGFKPCMRSGIKREEGWRGCYGRE